jgi:hypothetical protein
VLEVGQEPGRKPGPGQGHAGRQLAFDDWWRGSGPVVSGPAGRVGSGERIELQGELFEVLDAGCGDTGQVGPLIGGGFEGGGFEEDGGAVASARPVQGEGDQVPETLARQHVLGGEQPIVGAQIELGSLVHGMAEQSGADLAGGGCRHRLGGEEQPDVSALPERDSSRRGCNPAAVAASWYARASGAQVEPSKSQTSTVVVSPGRSG